MGITATFSDPYLESGAGSSAEVPHLYPVALDGVGYLIDDTRQFGHASLPLLRDQADTATQPSEQALSPEELWRRSLESWHRGAGQDYVDRPDSDPFRFRSSKGLDVWTRWQVSLLPATESKRTSSATNLQLVVAGSYLYVADGQQAYYTSDVSGTPTWTSADIQASETAADVESLASDGYYVYAALGLNGIHRNQRGTATTTHWNDLQATLLGYVKGRLMAAKDHELFNVTAAGAAPAALFTHPNTDFEWVGFAPGANSIYAAGYSGDKSLVYRTAVKADGSALDVPVVAGELPDGEIVRAIGGYLGFILLGTDKGVRFCRADDNGDLQVGELVGPEKAVRCFEGQDSFVWFGWSNYDSTDTGLGRLDLRAFIDTAAMAPAHASDLMATAQGNVLSVVTFQDLRVFAVSGAGIFGQTSNLVSSGTMDSGLISFGLPADDKVAMYLDVRHSPLAGSVSVSLSPDEGDFVLLGSSETAGTLKPSNPLVANETKASVFETRVSLSRSSSDATAGPDLTRITLRAYPAPPRGRVFIVPLLLHERLSLLDGQERVIDPEESLAALEDLEVARRAVSFQQGRRRETVIVDSIEWFPSHQTEDHSWWNGTAVLRLKRFSQT